MRCLRLKAIIFTFILISGCSSDKAKLRPPSPESLNVKRTIEILFKLNKAYEGKDSQSFMSYISSSFSPEYKKLEERIRGDFNAYEKISLNITFRWARVREDSIQLAIHWEGSWHDRAGKEVRDRGNGIFYFGDTEMRVIKIGGDNPFGISGE